MSEEAKAAAALLAVLVVGLLLIASGLGWGKLAMVGTGVALAAISASLLGAIIRR